MRPIDEAWLFERGSLHDARVVSFYANEGNIVIGLNDEWANERGLSKPEGDERPVVLRFCSATVISGDLSEIAGGRISELTMSSAGEYGFVFQDREAVLIAAASAEATSLESQS